MELIKPIFSIGYRYYTPLLFVFIFCLASPLWGQANKKKDVTPQDYNKWHTMVPDQISNNGDWCSYGVYYDTSIDTLVIKNIHNSIQYKLPNAFFSTFSSNSKWVFSRTRDDVFWQVNLNTGQEIKVSNVSHFWVAPNAQTMAYLKKNTKNKNKDLTVVNLNENTKSTYKNIFQARYNQSGRYLAMLQKQQSINKVLILDTQQMKLYTLFTSKNTSLYNLVWSPVDTRLAFFEVKKDDQITVHSSQVVKKGGIFPSDSIRIQNRVIDTNRRPTLFYSDDGKKIFYYLKKSNKDVKGANNELVSNVQVWNTNDELLYPGYKIHKERVKNPSYMSVWHWEKNKSFSIGDSIHTVTLIGAKAQYAFAYSYKTHSLSYVESEPLSTIDVYDITSGATTKVVDKPHGFEFQISPSGRYLAYFKKKNWWVYDAKRNTHANVTASLDIPFYDTDSQKNNPAKAYGNPGWTVNEEEIILYDKYDVWSITPNGKKSDRLTKGREAATKYRLYRLEQGRFEIPKYEGQYANIFNLDKGVIFSVQNTHNEHTGYVKFTHPNKFNTIVYRRAAIKNLRQSQNKKTLLYTQELYNLAPQLVVENDKKNNFILVQSNKQHERYNWGKSELVYYTNSKGKQLKGALFYPSNFDPNKKYPMITFVYERLSHKVHQYQNPTLHNSIGFSVSNYTTQGYFVFYPDIAYTIGSPGVSAVDCITAGVHKVIENPFINSDKLGIYGHSFGGYQVMFLITQTDLFTTAVAGAGASNLLSYYLSMAWLWDRPQYWRFEHQQWRMGDSYFNIPEAYERNSPIHQLNKVNTPLLSWAGKKDSNVNWQQHIELFLGLRRLKKTHNMLLYPDEGHDITTPKNQKDLTIRIQQWFDYYLKSQKPASWIINPH